ncbi:MAG: carboxyl transferase domain-containing protein, partial [Porticoccaceae bacterium]
ANRGEIAIRVMRSAAELGIETVAVYGEDDEASLHVRYGTESVLLEGKGAGAYLDGDQLVRVAQETGCDAIHPGYGFLSESGSFAALCEAASIKFVGPTVGTLEALGDKTKARKLALACDVPVAAGTSGPTSLEEAEAFLSSLPEGSSMVIKAIAGGGGRGMRVVNAREEVAAAYERCRSEALSAFGYEEVYVEEMIDAVRHIEIQIIGDGRGGLSHLHERECSLQRRYQKLVEIAPSPSLTESLRATLQAAALRMASMLSYEGLCTFEFLVAAQDAGVGERYVFLEANPRLQVEHTVTEEVTGIDLVRAQLCVAAGASLAELGLAQEAIPAPRGYAMQLRINMETMDQQGEWHPSGGILEAFEPPSGPGIRVDTFGYGGYRTNGRFDSLLAKLIVCSISTGFGDLVARAGRALSEFRIEGLETNIRFLQALLRHMDVQANRVDTRFIEVHVDELIEAMGDIEPGSLFPDTGQCAVQRQDVSTVVDIPTGMICVYVPLTGVVVELEVSEGDEVLGGRSVGVLEAMKMEHVVKAPASGIVRRVLVSVGDMVKEGQPFLLVEPQHVDGVASEEEHDEFDLDHIRPDLEALMRRKQWLRDDARPEAIAKRRSRNQRTARENIADLCDEGSFVEYGGLTVAAQRGRYTEEELVRVSPADGLITGIGSVNGELFDETRSKCIVLASDYTVFAGTLGLMGFKKMDRIFELASKTKVPIVFFTEGGGGRAGNEFELVGATGLDLRAPLNFAKLSALVPLIGVISGQAFAGNAMFLTLCDVVIATKNSSIGMGGPALVEGAGLGVYTPEEIGPAEVQWRNGVIDILVDDEADAVSAAKKYLSYFQGAVTDWSCADQRILRHLVPENRLRAYDMHRVIETLADTDSMLELRTGYGLSMITALVRVEGRPLGVVANNPRAGAGAVDAAGADKASRFMQLCDNFDIPILVLSDTPGVVVGPDAEKTATVRHIPRMFITGAAATVPVFTVITRKAYGGAGSAVMAGFGPSFRVSWPTGELGGMGIEGHVSLGYRKELESIADPVERQHFFDERVAELYETVKAENAASFAEIDDVIDPVETRRWIVTGLTSFRSPKNRTTKKHALILP